MKRVLLLIALMITALHSAAYAQSFEQVVQQFEGRKGAEVLKVPGALMKIALALANDDKDMPTEAREFIKHISSMTLLDMSECSSADKEAFASAMKSLQIDDFEAVETKDINTARLFFRKGEKKNQMIMASYDGENYSLSLMTGRFDEAMAAMYAAASNNKEEKK